jgi:protein-ribulosamine 3-kinase
VTLPAALSAAVADVLGAPISHATTVGGGSINNASRLGTNEDSFYFLKWNRNAPVGMFQAELDGLAALSHTNAVRVPEPVGHGTDADGTSWLLMEYVDPGQEGSEYQTRLGEGLAALHSTDELSEVGWPTDNWIGSLEQVNSWESSWAVFWRDHRIVPQLDLARRRGFMNDPIMDRVVDVTPLALGDVSQAGLLHGDLWGGNVFPDSSASPVLIDPAVYRGHGEVDLAMSELFGGFGRRFYEAYDSVIPVSLEYGAFRRDLYQLYYLLVHVNLFGASYEQGSLAAARRVVAALA